MLTPPARAARRRHRGERGQTLALAIAFLGFFGVFAASVLGFASQVQSQRGLTEKTAAIDSVTQGSAQFAISDTGVQGCGITLSGTMKFSSSDTLSYTAGAGDCTSSVTSAPGQNCGLCVLNFQNDKTPLSVQKGAWTVPGEVDVNGSIQVTSITSGLRIGLYGAGATCGTLCTPGAVALSGRVLDPLAGALPIPSAAANPPSASGSVTICPGTYKDLKTNGGTLVLDPYNVSPCATSTAPSLYIITGQISNAGNGNLVANGVTLYLTPSAAIDLSGNGDLSVDCGGPPVPATCTSSTPTTGQYAGVAVFVDPANNGDLKLGGNGNQEVSGTFEASHATLDMGGNGGKQAFQSGRLIVSELTGSGNGGAGLGFSGTVPNATGCNYWNDSVAGTEAGGSSQAGHVRFETGCNSGKPTTIIEFALGNGP